MSKPPLPVEEALRVVPRAASTTIVVRDGKSGLGVPRVEVLMVRRSLQASFMPGAYVFPGGAVDKADAGCACDESAEVLTRRIGVATGVGTRAAAHAIAALRECFEECGLWIGGGAADTPWATLRARLHGGEAFGAIARDADLALVTSGLHPWSRWCTPFGRPKRFDTLFFVVRAPEGQHPEVDANETITLEWVHVPSALAAFRDGRFPMEFATVQNLESLAPFSAGTATLLAHAAALRRVPFVNPRLRLDGEGNVRGVLLPHEVGYDDAFGAGIDEGREGR